MSHMQVTQALIMYGLLAAGLAGSLALFWSVKREIYSHAAKNRRRMEALARVIEHTPAQEVEPVYVLAAARSGMNINKRVQAMRMFRRNEDVSRIATVLGVTRREVELLIRVHQAKPQV